MGALATSPDAQSRLAVAKTTLAPRQGYSLLHSVGMSARPTLTGTNDAPVYAR
jgi:hypothetical protein